MGILRKGIDFVAGLIPGYKGYKDKEQRRDADRMLRHAIVTRLQERKAVVDRAIAESSRKFQFDNLEPLELVKRKLERVTDLVRHAPAGYSGFFDTAEIGPEQLDRIYENDAGVLERVNEVAQVIEGLPRAEDVPAAADQCVTALQNIEKAVLERDHLLMDVG
ncbi:MAG: hypothetical protein KDA05_04645 [Phycisphaerales bacterium]|nr:hypothetical protein [Phycisphaerales bacterium]MCB9840139.1 hypothetical protein [Phycisphaeraceae bacterium]